MENSHELTDFFTNLQLYITGRAEEEDKLRAEVFTEYMIEMLIESGDIEDGQPSHYKTRGMEVSGYNLDSDGTLNLFITNYTQMPQPDNIARGEIESFFKRLGNFLQKALDGYYTALEEASQAFDMAEHIFECRAEIIRARLYLFTDNIVTINKLPDLTLHDLHITQHIWDIRRIYRYNSSGKNQDPIHIDFIEQFGQPIPCLQGKSEGADYVAYLAIIPGNILNSLYASYGARLLELNVRSFLQAKGKVNQGIRKTIQEAPERFLAYNNGISATASNIELLHTSDGHLSIKSLDNLQIVNGGQTTASIFNAAKKDKADVSKLLVQAKISVASSSEINDLVPLISRYANSQNKVNEADFSANDPFHVKLEALSRTIWAPANNGVQFQTRWFYERARGQYMDALNRERTPARQRQFKELHPLAQKFTKTDLAKFEMTWRQLPHIVSLGAQKCFVQFTERVLQKGEIEVNQIYFQRLAAKAIIFRQAEKIIGAQKFGGYRANIVTYTIAYILCHSGTNINLDRIWQRQAIEPELSEAIEQVSYQIHLVIISPPGGKNVTEWCKRLECWTRVKSLSIDLSQLFSKAVQNDMATKQGSINEDGADYIADKKLIEQVEAVTPEVWYQLSSWAKETKGLQAWQRGFVLNLGRNRQNSKALTIKQAKQGLSILEEAYKLGFRSETAVNIE